MFNKFKNGERVSIKGKGKISGKLFFNRKATILFRDPYYKDYYVVFDDNIKEWFDGEYIKKIRQRRRKNESK